MTKEVTFIKRILNDGTKVIVYGAGNRGKEAVEILRNFNVCVKCIIDNNPVLWSQSLYGIPIVNAGVLNEKAEEDILLISIAKSEDLYKELRVNYSNVYATEYIEVLKRLTYLDCERYGYKRIEMITHFGSPYPNLWEVGMDKHVEIKEIDMNMSVQEKMAHRFLEYYQEIDLNQRQTKQRRYYEDNTTYGNMDALSLYGMICEVRPRNIVEIGSGFSSAVMLDTNEFCFDNKINLHFIEPYPERLKNILKKSDDIRLYEKRLEDMDFSIFNNLQEGDILFVDSSHMAKRGSDVNQIIFEVLPKLPCGVYIHFHDIFSNFEYPMEWLKNGWIWNESYLIRALLMNNSAYEIVFFCDLWNDFFSKYVVNFVGGANLWLRKK